MEPTPVVEPIPAGEPTPEAEPNLAVESALQIDPNPVVPILAHMTITPFPIPTPAKSGIKTSLICTQRAVDYSANGATDHTDVIRQARKHVNIDTASPRSQQ